jgi:hypothetical protein
MGPDNTIASWQEVDISEEQVPLGVDALPDAVGVFGYPQEAIVLNIDPLTAGMDTTKPPTQCYGENGIRYKKMVYYYEPQDFRGTSLLVSKPSDETKDNEQLIYLPSIRRIRRIPSGQDMDSPTGMDLSYDQLDRNPGKWDMNIIGEKTIYVDQPPISNCYGSETHRAYMDGKHCVVVEMTPRNKKWPISRDVLYYDKTSAACYYEEIYNKGARGKESPFPLWLTSIRKIPSTGRWAIYTPTIFLPTTKPFMVLPNLTVKGTKFLIMPPGIGRTTFLGLIPIFRMSTFPINS